MFKLSLTSVLCAILLLTCFGADAAPRKRTQTVPKPQLRAENTVEVQEAQAAEAAAAAPAEAPAEEAPSKEAPAVPQPASPGQTVQEIVPPAGAEPVITAEEVPPALDSQINLEYEQTPLAGAAQRSIRDEIGTSLIDLAPLQKALEGSSERERLQLTLAETIQVALEGNPEINVTVYEPMKAEADAFSARGEFDPMLQGSGTYSHSSQTANQQIETFGGISAIEDFRTMINGAIAGKLPYGTQYQLSVQFDKEETTFGNFVEEYSGMATLTVTQPLLWGFGKSVNLVRIRQAENARKLSEAQLKLTMMNTVAQVIQAYWDLVGAMANLKVQETALANAERLFQINKTRNEIGIAADIDVLQGKAGVATRQSDLVAANAQLADAGDRLKLLMGLKDGDRFSKAQILPMDRPDVSKSAALAPETFDQRVDESVRLALEKRPEVTMSEMEIANAELEEMRTRNEMLPQFDLTGSYGQGGRDHKLRQTIYGLRDRQDNLYSYGFQASVPIMNRAARGANQRAQLTTRQSEQRLEQTQQQLMLNVYVASRAILANQTLVESTARQRSIQEVNVIAEEKKLRLGTTTSFQVLQIQEDLTVAQTQEVQAQIAYEKALVELQLAEGTLLENLDIEFAPENAPAPEGYWRSITPRWE